MPQLLQNFEKIRKGRPSRSGNFNTVIIDNEERLANAYSTRLIERNRVTKEYMQKNKDLYLFLIKIYKIVFYEMKILKILFPKNFPDWYFSGMNKDWVLGSVRKKISGHHIILPNSFKEIEKLFADYKLELEFDFYGDNFIKENSGDIYYVDEPNIFIKNPDDVGCILALAEHRLSQDPDRLLKLDRIKLFAERILAISKEQYEIVENKVVIKR
jgi:hypothetical protein